MGKHKSTTKVKKNLKIGFKSESGLVHKHKEKLFKKPKQMVKLIKNQLNIQNNDVCKKKKKQPLKTNRNNSVSLKRAASKKKKKKFVEKSPSTDEESFVEDSDEDIANDCDISEEDIANDCDISEEDISSDCDSEEDISNDRDISEEDVEMSDENELPIIKKSQKRKGAASKYTFSGDISEEDIDSDDNFSLDEDELPVPPDVTTSEDESSDEEDIVEEEKEVKQKEETVEQKIEHEKRTVFVGNLPKSVTKAKLKRWFTKYGKVESVRLRFVLKCAPVSDPSLPKKLAVIMKTFHDERSNIHGFVRFSTVEEAKNALAANGQQFDETHHLRVDMANLSGKHRKFDDKKAVFVGNLPFGAEEDELRDHFADCGDIVCIRIVRDKHTSVGKGFAFINFAARHSVRLALEKDGIELKGRQLRIQKAFYNQEVEIVKEQQKRKASSENSFKKNKNNFVTKFKKKKRKNEDDQEFQGVRTNKKGLARKKISKKKKKLKKKKHTLKEVLNKQDNKEKRKK